MDPPTPPRRPRSRECGLAAIDPAAGFAEQVTGWLFPTGVTAHVVLVAALRNPTIRLHYVAARETLVDYGHSDTYADLLRLLGSADLAPERVADHIRALERVFDMAAAVGTTPFFFRSDISPAARPVAIGASTYWSRPVTTGRRCSGSWRRSPAA